MTPRRLVEVLEGWRFSVGNEQSLLAGIQKVLEYEGVVFQTNVRLPGGETAPFLVDGMRRYAVTALSAGAPGRCVQQLARESTLQDVVVASPRSKLPFDPETGGATVHHACLVGSA